MIVFDFFRWYYGEAVLGIFRILGNFLEFSFNFFGIRYHFATLFRPWHLIVVRFDQESGASRIMLNMSSRLIASSIGFFVRSFTILVGILTLLVLFLGSVIVVVLWLFLPLILALLFFQGASLVL